ncbi:type IV secretory system conjugative DNA transfer family protein [Paraburkholderia humisilvae]|nr:type IV secretory system conjugative DNA transfer family protein [Paraburkholderia humisilvae]
MQWAFEWIGAKGLLGTYVSRMLWIVCGGIVASIAAGFTLYYRRSLKTESHDELHGSAHWATERDVQKMGLLSYERWEGPVWRRRLKRYKATGLYVGLFDTSSGRQVMRYSDPAHVLCEAPSRSGKGVGPVITTLLSYPESTATNDIKGENFELTSGFRHTAGTLVIRFDPTALDQKSIDGKSRYNVAACWNALDEIRTFTEYDVMDAQNLAQAIADPDGQGMDDHWVSTSYEFLTGLILHVKYYERDKSLTGVSTYMADPSFEDPEQMFLRMLQAEHDTDGSIGWRDSAGHPTKTHPQVAISARAMLNREEKERNSVLSTAKTKLSLFTEPIVARNTARSDFSVSDLMNHPKPVSFYLVVPPSDKERLRPLIRLFITFLLRRLTSSMEFEDGRSVKDYLHRLLLLIDELPSLRKLDQLQDGLGYLAGYGITAFLFVQDPIQLKEVYGDNETISAGCQLRIAYAPNTLQSADDISERTGVTTVKRQNVSYSGNRMSAMLGQMSLSEEHVERNLLTKDEVMRLPRDEILVFNTGHPPIRGKKLKYFEMPEFQKRAKISSPSRVAMTYAGERGKVVGEWFMVHCERPAKGNELAVTVNVYREFPPVRVVVKQEHVEREVVQEFAFALVDSHGAVVDRPLTTEDLRFVARPAGDMGEFDIDEAFEVHFLVDDSSSYKHFSQTGFFRDISVHERVARRKTRDFFHELEEKEGARVEPTIERISPDARYTGRVLLETSHYIVLQRLHDRAQVSVHRKSKLDRVVKIGEEVTIKYTGKKGVVA